MAYYPDTNYNYSSVSDPLAVDSATAQKSSVPQYVYDQQNAKKLSYLQQTTSGLVGQGYAGLLPAETKSGMELISDIACRGVSGGHLFSTEIQILAAFALGASSSCNL